MQLTLGVIRGCSAADADRLREAVVDAIKVISPKELAYALDIAPSYLSEAMTGKQQRDIRLSWLPTIIAMAPEAHRIAILRELGAPVGLSVTRTRDLTPEEKLERLEQRLVHEFGPAGMRLVEEMKR
jgi:hypothetical protein